VVSGQREPGAQATCVAGVAHTWPAAHAGSGEVLERGAQYVPGAVHSIFEVVEGQRKPAGQSASLVVRAGQCEPEVHGAREAGVVQ